MLQMNMISLSFGTKQVLKNLSCTVQAGDFIVIVGTNGAGKSSFFDTISGKRTPSTGTITLDETDITHCSELQRSAWITRIFQNTHLNCVGSLTVAENLALSQYSKRYVRFCNGMQSMPRQRAHDIIKTIGMDSAVLDVPMNQLSGGQRQLIAFAMALQHTPKLLLLDEPTAALDPQAATILLQHAARSIATYGITTLLITHDPQIALSVGNKIWILEQGIIARTYEGTEKKQLKAEQLIGQIDYESLARIAP